jgi:hypothetical protein
LANNLNYKGISSILYKNPSLSGNWFVTIINWMKTIKTRIIELIRVPSGLAVKIPLPANPVPLPGQFLQGFSSESRQILPIALFLLEATESELILAGQIPLDWVPGSPLRLQGAFGNGFHLPKSARKVALFTATPELGIRLLPLAFLALHQSAEVSWLSESSTVSLPPEIEVLRPGDMTDVLKWADYAAIATNTGGIGQILGEVRRMKEFPRHVEVMVDTPLLCANKACCGLCAVSTTKGWKFACKDGPVFALHELVSEDGHA